MRLMPNGTGKLLMASFMFTLVPSCIGAVHPWLGDVARSLL